MIARLDRNTNKLTLNAEELPDHDLLEKLLEVDQHGLWVEVNDSLTKILGDK